MQNCKLVMVGDGAVGKTSFFITYTSNQFPEDYEPTVLYDYWANVMVDDKLVKVDLWDTSGQSDYDGLRPLSYRQTDVFVIAYSVANPPSFENVTAKWIPEIQQHCPNVPFVLFGTKTDLRDDQATVNALAEKGMACITTEQGEYISMQTGASGFFEVSAKRYRGLREAMDHVARVGIGLIVMDDEPVKPPRPDPPVFAPPSEVCDELELLVNGTLFHDVVFRVEDKEIYGHKFVLCSASPLFEKLILEHQPIDKYFTSKSDNNVCVVSVSQVSHVEFLEFVNFVYSGKAKQSPTNDFIQLVQVCDLDYKVDRRTKMAKAIATNLKTMHDFEIVSLDKKRFKTSKALLWSRSEYFREHDLRTRDSWDEEMPSAQLAAFLDYVHEGTLPNVIANPWILGVAQKLSSGMLNSIAHKMTLELTTKNVFEWTDATRSLPAFNNYCVWFMRVNFDAIKNKKKFLALPETLLVASFAWPGTIYEQRCQKWAQDKRYTEKKVAGDRCLIQ